MRDPRSVTVHHPPGTRIICTEPRQLLRRWCARVHALWRSPLIAAVRSASVTLRSAGCVPRFHLNGVTMLALVLMSDRIPTRAWARQHLPLRREKRMDSFDAARAARRKSPRGSSPRGFVVSLCPLVQSSIPGFFPFGITAAFATWSPSGELHMRRMSARLLRAAEFANAKARTAFPGIDRSHRSLAAPSAPNRVR